MGRVVTWDDPSSDPLADIAAWASPRSENGLLNEGADSLRELIETAQAAQPAEMRPENGEDVREAGRQFAETRARHKWATLLLAKEVRNAHRAGLSVQDCARLAGVTRRTAYKWIAKDSAEG